MTEQDVLDVVRRTTMEVLPEVDPERVTADGTTLTELGANSIDRADIVTTVMEELGVAVPVAAFAQVRDIRSLVAVLLEHC